jgi:hypothetical protein
MRAEVSILQKYRSTPAYVASAIAVVAAFCMSWASGFLFDYIAEFLMGKFSHAVNFGLLVVPLLGIPSGMIRVFIATVAVLVNLHHPTSWRTPTLAFGFCCIVLTSYMEFFPPIGGGTPPLGLLLMLATGVVTWLVSCWLLRRKGIQEPMHVL